MRVRVERVAHRAAEREGEHERGQDLDVLRELGEDDREGEGHARHAAEHLVRVKVRVRVRVRVRVSVRVRVRVRITVSPNPNPNPNPNPAHRGGADEGEGAALPAVDEARVEGELADHATQQPADAHAGHEVTCGVGWRWWRGGGGEAVGERGR